LHTAGANDLPRNQGDEVLARSIKRRIERLVVALTQDRQPHGGRVVVLTYHSVHPTRAWASATPDDFARHITWIKENCELVDFGSIPRIVEGGGSDRPVVAITFDDGYDDNHTYAFPLLASMGVPATVFATTGLIEGDPAVVDRFCALWGTSPEEEIRGLSWTQMEEMQASRITFGAHTVTHPNLAELDGGAARKEMLTSRDVLEERLQVPVVTFAYPFGNPRYHLSDETTRCAAEAGFDTAGTVQFRGVRPKDAALRVPRFPITQDPIEVLRAKVLGGLDVIGAFRDRVPRWVLDLTSGESPRRLTGRTAG
jgi:peptidoglycan/xylan/chitin deacetylase (PgdA/CDA1 family)